MVRLKDWLPAIVVGAVLAAVVGVYYYRVVDYQWWVPGPYLYDTELFNYVVGPHSQGLKMPPVIGLPSLFYSHVSPLLMLFNPISAILGLKEGQPLQLMMGVGFCGSVVMAFVAMLIFLQPLGRWAAIGLAAVFALAYSFSGIMHTTAWYPHMEILYPPLAIGALLLIFHRRTRWAWLPFMGCLFVREDAGLHMACILGAYLVLAAIAERGKPARTGDILPFLGAAIVYPILVIWGQNAFLPIESNFARVYSGVPAYAHLNAALLVHRWDALVHVQPQSLYTLAAALAAFIIRPRWVALTGIVAAMPWFLVSVTAVYEASGTLSAYYGFPFLALAVVPFIVTAKLPVAEDAYVAHL